MPRYSFNQRSAERGPMSTRTNTQIHHSRTQKYRKPAIEYSHDPDSVKRLAQRSLARGRKRETLLNPDWVAVKELFDEIICGSKPARTTTKKGTRRCRRRAGHSASKRHSILDTMDMDIDIQVADTTSQLPEQQPNALPRDADGNLDLSSVPYSAENWTALLHTPSTSSHRSRSGSLAASSVHGSVHSTPFLRRASFPDTNVSHHADPSRPTPLPLWIDTAAEPTAARSEWKEAEKAEDANILPASALASEIPAPVPAPVSAPAPTAASTSGEALDDDDDGSYRPEGDDKDNTSEISSAPPSPGIPEAARELERRYCASQQTTPQKSSEPTPVSARPPSSPELNLISASDMSFTLNPLPSPDPPSASSSSRPSLRIETGELHIQQPEAPFTAYPAEPQWAQQCVQPAPPQPSVLGLSMDTASDNTPYPHEVSSNAVDTNVYPQHVSPPVSSLPPVPFQASHDVAGPSGYTHRTSINRLQACTSDVAAMTGKINRSINFIKVAAQCGARVSSHEVLNVGPESQTDQSSRVGVGSAIDRAILDFRKTLIEMNQLAYQLFTVDLPGFLTTRQNR